MNIIKNNIAVIILGLLVVAMFIFVFTKNEKIAYIDTSKLMENSKEIQSLKKKGEADAQAMKSNSDTLMMEFQEELKKYEKDLAIMSKKEKQLSTQLLETKRNQILQYQQAVKQKAQQEEQQKTQAVLVNINKRIEEYGKAKGYKVIFATTNGNIAYADEAINITDDIVLLINK